MVPLQIAVDYICCGAILFLVVWLVLPRLTSKAKEVSYQQVIHNGAVIEERHPKDSNSGIHR